MAPRIASVLYGVIAIMTADLIVEPDRLKYAESTWGVLLIGLAMTLSGSKALPISVSVTQIRN